MSRFEQVHPDRGRSRRPVDSHLTGGGRVPKKCLLLCVDHFFKCDIHPLLTLFTLYHR